jgi:hypothetical protein
MKRFALVIAFATLTSAPVQARQGSDCDVQFRADRTERLLFGATRRFYFGGNVVFSCRDLPRVSESDSAAWYEDRNRMDFLGNVRFEDSTVTLDADRAFYFMDDDRLEAFGNVRLVNLATGSVLIGENLTYWQAVEGVRDTAEMFARQRPTIEYLSSTDTADAEPYVIVGNQIRMKGSDLAWAGGTVTIDRSDFHARGDSTELDMGLGNGVLVGNAFVSGEEDADSSQSFTIAGRTIQFTFVDNDLNWMQSRGLADARSGEWRIISDTLELLFANDVVQHGFAWGDSTRASAVSALNTIKADSIAIDSPDQVLEEIRSFGTARATSVRDSVDTGADWVAGDTVIARFAEAEDGERFLASLGAEGNALALYRVFKDLESPESQPDINYSRGLSILASFSPTGIQRVEVTGKADGVHLAPINRGNEE